MATLLLLCFDEVVDVDGEVGYRSDKEGLFWVRTPPRPPTADDRRDEVVPPCPFEEVLGLDTVLSQPIKAKRAS